MAFNAAIRQDVRRAEKAAKLAEQNRGVVIVALCSTAEGRRYLWDQLSAAHIFATTFTDDARRSAFLEGERNTGLRLLDDLTRFAPDQFLLMMREANGRRDTASEQPRSADGNGGDQEPASGDGDYDPIFPGPAEDHRGLD